MKKINNLLLIFSIAFLSIKVYSQERIRVVNMIPRLLSGEINQDSEPNIAVNPSNISEIAASCFRGNPAIGSANAPIFISSDGGLTWNLNNIVPVVNPMNGTGDISIKFSPSGNSLYSGILTDNRQNIMNILKTDDPFSSNPMQSLITRANTDQPYVNVTTDATRQDWLFIGNNIFPPPPNGRSAAVEHSDAFFLRTIIERRNTSGQDRPSVRCASHSNGTVYGLFARTTNNNGVNRTCDVTVVRDDNFGTGIPFTALVGGDGNSGVIVATGVNMPFINAGGLGQHRLGSHMSTTVNPANSNEAFIAWTDRTGMVGTNLHVRQSIDNGVNWSGDLLNIPNGLNPAMAINSDGVIGVLYQQLVNGRWEVHLQRSIDRINWTDLVLSNTPDNTPPPTFQPYLGDYIDLMCVGQNFYGVFSASNVPNNANFPQGVTYQRIANFATNQLIDRRGNTVNPSIDPFFFAIEPTNVFINSLNVEITVGDDHLGDTAWPHRQDISGDIVTIFLSDGTSIPLSLNQGQTWLANSTHNRTIPLPDRTLIEDIRSIEIRHNAAGPDWGADNWTIQRIIVTATPTSGGNREILDRFGSPLWQFRKNNNQVLEFNF